MSPCCALCMLTPGLDSQFHRDRPMPRTLPAPPSSPLPPPPPPLPGPHPHAVMSTSAQRHAAIPLHTAPRLPIIPASILSTKTPTPSPPLAHSSPPPPPPHPPQPLPQPNRNALNIYSPSSPVSSPFLSFLHPHESRWNQTSIPPPFPPRPPPPPPLLSLSLHPPHPPPPRSPFCFTSWDVRSLDRVGWVIRNCKCTYIGRPFVIGMGEGRLGTNGGREGRGWMGGVQSDLRR